MSDLSAKNIFFLGLGAFAMATSFQLYSMSKNLEEQTERVTKMAIKKKNMREKKLERDSYGKEKNATRKIL